MNRFLSLRDLPIPLRGASIAIGNFDGVHLGHQAVIDLARRDRVPLGVMTFEPHPRSFFAAQRGVDIAPYRLMNAEARANRLEKLGIDVLFELPFNAALAGLSPQDFVQEILVDGIGASHVVVGADFQFGKGRSGTAQDLQTLCRAAGIEVTIAELVDHGETEVSSTNIRKALSAAKPDRAAEMLGHWHRIEGPVIHGEKRGRELGYPTANMSIAGLHQPAFGVYAVVVDVLDGDHAGSYHGAASIGVRPMFGENHPNCETFLFDFKGDLYGATLSIGLVAFLRGEERFDTLDALITQMDADCAKARRILAAL